MSVTACMGLYMNVQFEEILEHLQALYGNDVRKGTGSYIFFSVTDIREMLSRIPEFQSSRFEKWVKFHGGDLNISNVTELMYKIVFMHEAGHMAFGMPSARSKKQTCETLANWVASVAASEFEKEVMRLITDNQPEEYRQFITKPEGYYSGYDLDPDDYVKEMSALIDGMR